MISLKVTMYLLKYKKKNTKKKDTKDPSSLFIRKITETNVSNLIL